MGQLHEDKKEAGGGYVLKVLQGYLDKLEREWNIGDLRICRQHVGWQAPRQEHCQARRRQVGSSRTGDALWFDVTGSQAYRLLNFTRRRPRYRRL
jgi:hypothetical protein